MAQNDYYETLGVSKDSSAEDIKRAFRKKAAQFHPDRNKDPKAPEEFKKVNEAYQVLSDNEKRRVYDQYGSGAFNGSGGGFNGYSGGGVEIDFSDIFNGGGFGDIFGDNNPFGDIFGSRRRTQDRNRGEDIAVRLQVTLEDVINGPEKEISYSRKEQCKTCTGLGGQKVETCKTCKGSGRVAQVSRSLFGNIQVMRECAACKGTGKEILEKCQVCKGESVVDGIRSFKIRIPKGIESGLNLQFTGEGNAGKFQGTSGDLFVQIDVKNDKNYVREGDNLVLNMKLPLYSLVLGDEIEVETFDGNKKVKIPAGLNFGEKLTLEGLGIPNMRTKHRGNIVLKVDVDMPKNLSKEEKDLYLRLQEISERKGKPFWRK